MLSGRPFEQLRAPCALRHAWRRDFFECGDLLDLVRQGGDHPRLGRPFDISYIRPILTSAMPAEQYGATLETLAQAGWRNEDELFQDLALRPPAPSPAHMVVHNRASPWRNPTLHQDLVLGHLAAPFQPHRPVYANDEQWLLHKMRENYPQQ
jgi:hypothetical protein